jgi:hypothetical protein
MVFFESSIVTIVSREQGAFAFWRLYRGFGMSQ